MKRSFLIILFQTLFFSTSLFAFDINVDYSEFCIDNKPNTLIFTITHQSTEQFQSISGLDHLGVLTDTIDTNEGETILVVALDNSILTIDEHEILVTLVDTVSLINTTETQVIDVFGPIERTINYNFHTDLIYYCDYVSINFTTDGDSLTDELVLVYIDKKFHKEQKLVLNGKIGTLTDLRIDRLYEDSLAIELYLESSRNNQCLKRVKIEERYLDYIAPIAEGKIDPNYSVSDTRYGEATFSSNSINSTKQIWEVYENGDLIGSSFLLDNDNFQYVFSTSNFEKGATQFFKTYDIIIIASDASGAIDCMSGINRDTLKNIEVPYFPRIKVPTAISKRSSISEDGSFRLLIRERVIIETFNIQIFDSSNQLVFESADPNFVFGDDETFNSQIYNAKIFLHYDDGFNERVNTSFIVTP